MKTKILSVRLYGVPIGLLEQTKEGKMRFDYLEDAKQALSYSMPLSQKRYGNMPCETYFAGLLPESEEAKRAIGQKFDCNPYNTFAMLKAIGHDCAGAVSLEAPDTPIESDKYQTIEVKPLSNYELEKHIIDLPRKPLFIGVKGLRLSLAGVQEKAAVCLVKEEICLPLYGTPTTHILKPSIKRFPESVQNEYICLKSAQKTGLPIPNVDIRLAKDEIYLLVERYDRKFDHNKKISRLHQEDFCQALGFREKYQRRGGPGLKECFDLMLQTNLPVVDRNTLMQAVVFNYLIGNADAHGKNFSILHKSENEIRLAPFYDILCTQAYEELSNDICMKVGDHYDFNEITADDWEKLCKQIGFSFPALKKLIYEQANSLADIVNQEKNELVGTKFEARIADQILETVKKNCKYVRKILK